ncbi:MAG: helix-turn-helix domain-containing protein [Sphingobacteriales bacterium]|jgi:DNA-binding XRE family transcriptional regulator
MVKTALKMYTLDEMLDKHIGKKGSKAREKYEIELSKGVLGSLIRQTRKERKLTQEQLGKKLGVQKAQISKLENGASSATIDTILKVFNALKADVFFKVELRS